MHVYIQKENVKDKDVLFDLYTAIEASGRLNVFMYEDNSLQAFLDKFSKAWVYSCYVEDKLVGFTAFDSFQGKSAFFHFCMLNELGDKYAFDFGRIVFHTVFRDKHLLQVFGLTPCIYRHVFPLLIGIGFNKIQLVKEVAKIGNKNRNAWLSCLTIDNFYEVNKEYLNAY